MKDIYDDYEEYYGGGGHKLHMKNQKKKFKGKGHQSKHQRPEWKMIEEDDELIVEEVAPKPVYIANAPTTSVQKPKTDENKFIPGPNTHTIKGNIIDFDRVANIEKIEGEHNSLKTYGIKFTFVGKKGSFRIAWFNVNIRERDYVYNSEFAFWQKTLIAQKNERI